jgi:predicted regulator of Ras-like GTPase activity (Roadblock/LC7/MglB family)
MTQLDDALLDLKAHDGVEHVLLVGTDGLLVRHVGGGDGPDPERIAAMLPGLTTAAGAFARAVAGGDSSTTVLEMDQEVAIVVPLSPELLLAVLLRGGVGFRPLLRDLRRERGRLAGLV